MPRVVPDQRSKFENDEMFRKLSRESEVRMRIHFLRFKSFCTGFYALVSLTCIFFLFSQIKYTMFRDRPQAERVQHFQNDCREGRINAVSVF
jgi:hypothetical protein